MTRYALPLCAVVLLTGSPVTDAHAQSAAATVHLAAPSALRLCRSVAPIPASPRSTSRLVAISGFVLLAPALFLRICKGFGASMCARLGTPTITRTSTRK